MESIGQKRTGPGLDSRRVCDLRVAAAQVIPWIEPQYSKYAAPHKSPQNVSTTRVEPLLAFKQASAYCSDAPVTA
eukprot:642601-Pelagomonas_calceolata.AAC.3